MKKSRVNPYSHVTFHKGYTQDPIRHTVTAASQLSPDMREVIEAELKAVVSGHEARALANVNGWGVENLDHRGRVVLVKYKGVEAALFWERQLINVEPAPGENLPEGVLKDPADTWQRLDLLGPSARQANVILSNRIRQLEQQVEVLETASKVKDIEVQHALHAQNKAEGDLERKVKIIAHMKSKYEPADNIVVRRAGVKYVTEKQAKAMRKALAKKKGRNGKKK